MKDVSDRSTEGRRLGRRLVDAHGGRTGVELAMAMLAQLAGRAVGAAIVEAHGGKTGAALASAMSV